MTSSETEGSADIWALLRELNQSACEFPQLSKLDPAVGDDTSSHVIISVGQDEDFLERIEEQMDEMESDLDDIVLELASLVPSAPQANGLNQAIRRYFDNAEVPQQDEERLDSAISIQELGISFISDRDPEMIRLLSNLGYSYKCRFRSGSQLKDIEGAIQHETRAVLLAGTDHAELPSLLGNLGTSHWCRFERLGDAKDIERAITCQNHAVYLTPKDHQDFNALLNDLGNSYHSRFEGTGKVSDINMSIAYHDRAVSLTPEGSETWSLWLLNLGNSYRARFEYLGGVEDIEKAISLQTRVVPLLPDDHPRKAEGLSNLGNSYRSRFKRLGRIEDIENAIACQERAVELTPNGHVDEPPHLYNLGRSYGNRFERLGNIADIKSTITCQSQAVLLTPEGHRDKPAWLNALGIAHRRLFDYTGDISDIDRAISSHTQAVSLTPESHADMPSWLTGLSNSHQSRFERLGELEDIDKAIQRQKYAVSLVPEEDAARPSLLTSLGNAYLLRYRHLERISDIDQAIACQREAVSLIPQGHNDLPGCLNNLANSLTFRFRQIGHPGDIEDAIAHLSQWVDILPNSHTIKPSLLSNLGSALLSRFDYHDDIADIDRAISCYSQAFALIPEDYAERPSFLNNLGEAYHTRFRHLGDFIDISSAIKTFQKASKMPSGRPSQRYYASCKWAQLSVLHHGVSSPLQAYEQVMTLIPHLVWLGTTITRRYSDIASMGDLAMQAAAIAIDMQAYEQALEWLEQGRSIVWNQILRLRTPVDALRAVDASLAKRFEDTAHALEFTSTETYSGSSLTHTELYAEEMSQLRRHLAQEWDQLIQEVRSHPQFHDFLRPMKTAELRRAAAASTVVVINVDRRRCDALVVVPGSTSITHIPLPSFSYGRAIEVRTQLLGSLQDMDVRARSGRRPVFYADDDRPDFEKALATLWSDVAQPVLNSLGYLQAITGESLPHVTWCTTGPLAFLPIHAAGCYDEPHTRVFDFVVSSYTPTLSALLATSLAPNEFHGILAVGQAATQGCEPLPGTVAELVQIEKQAGQIPFTKLDGDGADATTVLAEMENHSWVHLACHASQSTVDPTASAFLLHDSKLDLSTIMRKSLGHGQFAFLSACQTATGDESTPEEAIHLAAGMLVAGYPTVIATMWSIKDEDAPLVAKEVYAHLLEGGVPNSRKAAKALHNAVGCLRDKVGDKAFARWVPYIHLGL